MNPRHYSHDMINRKSKFESVKIMDTRFMKAKSITNISEKKNNGLTCSKC